ncbi:hypothetical protein X798_05835 [Onchocerca flexuosa]|uniref:Uncharacterized protein n=1 Tax=Onchocerca flexuosa TaxID=387005 RepID=A0A238BR64_9BILA|nr:hypothetical protein X798_05835 [Onchocerca flexuosa]
MKFVQYFDCQCERCIDPSDDILTSIRCINEQCDETLIITEDSKPVNIQCPKCKQITSEDRVKMCQELMLKLPVRFGIESNAEDIQQKHDEAVKYLHSKNVYVTRLKAALLYVTGSLSDNLLFVQKICFGLNHPYYLQTLALWTFLDKDIPKTDEELIALMNFNSNKPLKYFENR